MKASEIVMSALLIVCAVSSCSKSKSTPNANEGTTLSWSKTTIRDTIVSYHIYDRDANNRLTAIRDSAMAFEFTMNLVYNNGILAKAVFLEIGQHPIYRYEFEYNADGRISKRENIALKVVRGYNVYVYDASGRLAIDSQYSIASNGTHKLEMVSKFQYTGDNITDAESYTMSNGTLELDTKLRFEYDNGINPVKDLEYEYYLEEARTAIYIIPLKSRNNIVKMNKADGNGGWDVLQTQTHQYNSNNYAWKSTSKIVSPVERTDVEYFFQ